MITLPDTTVLSKFIIPQNGLRNISTASTTRASGNEFQNVLKALQQNTQAAPAGLSATDTLNKDQLLLFIKALQIQMNSRLYNTVFSHALEDNALASKVMQDYGGNFAHLLAPASKNSQSTVAGVPSEKAGGLDQIIDQAAQEYNLDARLIRSVIKVESNFDPSATSPVGAMGLMQLMPETARELGVKNAYDPRENVMGGARYLKMLLNRYDGQVDLALAAYNWGMGNLERRPDRMPAETVGYIAKVNAHYQGIKS